MQKPALSSGYVVVAKREYIRLSFFKTPSGVGLEEVTLVAYLNDMLQWDYR